MDSPRRAVRAGNLESGDRWPKSGTPDSQADCYVKIVPAAALFAGDHRPTPLRSPLSSSRLPSLPLSCPVLPSFVRSARPTWWPVRTEGREDFAEVIEEIIRVTQDNDDAVAFGLAGARIIEACVLGLDGVEAVAHAIAMLGEASMVTMEDELAMKALAQAVRHRCSGHAHKYYDDGCARRCGLCGPAMALTCCGPVTQVAGPRGAKATLESHEVALMQVCGTQPCHRWTVLLMMDDSLSAVRPPPPKLTCLGGATQVAKNKTGLA